MPRGGKRENAGRKAGVPNKLTGEVKQIAQEYGPGAIEKAAELAGLIRDKPAATSEAAQMAAINTILDRAYGKPSQVIAGDPDNPLTVINEIALRGVRPADRDADT